MATSRAPVKPVSPPSSPAPAPVTTPPAAKPAAAPARRAVPASLLRWVIVALLVVTAVAGAMIWRALNRSPAEVYVIQRGTATAAVYGTVKIQPNVTREVRAQNVGFIRLESGIQSGVVSIGSEIKRDQVLATIVDEVTERALRASPDRIERRGPRAPEARPALRAAPAHGQG